MTISQSYRRIAPDGQVSTVLIKNQAVKEYHENLREKHGYKYYLISYAQDRVCEACGA